MPASSVLVITPTVAFAFKNADVIFLALTLFEASITLVYLVGSIGRVVGIMLVSLIIKLLLSVSFTQHTALVCHCTTLLSP